MKSNSERTNPSYKEYQKKEQSKGFNKNYSKNYSKEYSKERDEELPKEEIYFKPESLKKEKQKEELYCPECDNIVDKHWKKCRHCNAKMKG